LTDLSACGILPSVVERQPNPLVIVTIWNSTRAVAAGRFHRRVFCSLRTFPTDVCRPSQRGVHLVFQNHPFSTPSVVLPAPPFVPARGASFPGSRHTDHASGVFVGEFDPGSGRTLAACLMHASRTHLRVSGARLRNAWLTCPGVGDNGPKGSLSPHTIGVCQGKPQGAPGGGRAPLDGWCGNGAPSP
jgi:hypothetical protein